MDTLISVVAELDAPELTSGTKESGKRSLFKSSVGRNASAIIQQASDDLKHMISFSDSQSPVGLLGRTKSTADFVIGKFRFISKYETWYAVESRFDKLAKGTDGLLPGSLFGECIGMNKDSKEFGEVLFDSLSRRLNITGNLINKAQLEDFWNEINQGFDSRLQTLLDMVDKDSDGKITEDELIQIINVSASANRLENIKIQADEYAAMIMEELDLDNLGYITIEDLEMLLLQAPTHIMREQNSSDNDSDIDTEDPEMTLFAKGLEKRSSFGLPVVRNTSARIRLVSECNHLYSASKRLLEGRLDRTSSAFAHAFTGLHFISQDDGMKKDEVIEKRMSLPVPFSLNTPKRLLRPFRSGVPIKILKVAVYSGNVLALHMSKPQGFKYKSGQYVFVNCAAVSSFEWHPFFITSAPSDDYLSVHIRTIGDWTRQLKTIFVEVCEPPSDTESGLLYQGDIPRFPKVLIDGPYNGQAQNYKKYEVVLLVGLGIGATPMISIAKDLMNNMKLKEEEEDDALENEATLQKSTSQNIFRTTRAYFYWVTREQSSFDWFKGAMNEVIKMDKNGVIEMHNYCTSVYEEGDARSALITMLQSLNHAKNGVDVVSGTHVKVHFGKPNWRDAYRQIAHVHTGSRVGVFYCGPSALTKELKQLALDFSHKTSTKFDFYKENV